MINPIKNEIRKNFNFYVQNQILSSFKKKYPQIFFGITMISIVF